jgi:CRP-like cAMP-binding protein
MDPLARALALRSAALFDGLPADSLLPIAALCSEVDLEPEQPLFRAGDPGDALYVIIVGAVRVEQRGETVAVLRAGECVGEMAVLDSDVRGADVVGDQVSRLIRLDRNDLLDLLGDQPSLLLRLARVLAARLRTPPP